MSSIDAVMNSDNPGPSTTRDRREDYDPADDFNAMELREDSEGWNDVEDDAEDMAVKCLFCENESPSVAAMVQHCKASHDFDLVGIVQRHGLDFYGSIKFVNYVRSQVASGDAKPDMDDSAKWQDDKYLQPVLENDALLFSLDELDNLDSAEHSASKNGKQPDNSTGADDVATLKEQLSRLQSQFDAYRSQVSDTLSKRWSEAEGNPNQPTTDSKEAAYDTSYFESYSYNDIHQTMLQDTVRTDSYRDFIYNNKHLFAGKTVLDVGCGTGILSMFAAKAGAKQVFAIDNSAILDKARQIAGDNGLLSTITFVRGKIEDLAELPGGVKEVDVIVSEWMGYCLFFENMLPSVLTARDRFMKRRSDNSFDGVMVPSHCSVHLAPMADPDWVADNVTFWHDVYGFDMKPMMEGALEDVVVQHPPQETIAGRTTHKQPVRMWDLYQTKVEDLEFETPFKVELEKDIDALDSWCNWFDIVFSPAPAAEANAPANIDPAEQERLAKAKGAVSFSTGPLTKRTHWQCGVCVIERKGQAATELKAGSTISGLVRYGKGKDARAYDLEMSWESRDAKEKGKQVWKLK